MMGGGGEGHTGLDLVGVSGWVRGCREGGGEEEDGV